MYITIIYTYIFLYKLNNIFIFIFIALLLTLLPRNLKIKFYNEPKNKINQK